MNESQALKFFAGLNSVLAAVKPLESEIKEVFALMAQKADLERDVCTLEVRERDSRASLAGLEKTLTERRAAVAGELAALTSKLAVQGAGLKRELATAIREHEARIRAMRTNEAKVAAEAGA